MANFSHRNDYGFVLGSKDLGADVAPLECATVVSLTTAVSVICPRKLFLSRGIQLSSLQYRLNLVHSIYVQFQGKGPARQWN